MKTTYVVAGLVLLATAIAVVYILSQPRGAPVPVGSLGAGNTAATTFAGIWGGLGGAGAAAIGAAES